MWRLFSEDFPDDPSLQQFEHDYKSVFRPALVNATPDAIPSLTNDNARSPLIATLHGLDVQSLNREELRIFLFDPNSSLDLIDLWNLRIFFRFIVPIPIDWFGPMSDYITDMINENYRPLPDNKHGVMIRSTVQISRSLASEGKIKFISETLSKCKKHSYAIQPWYDTIWRKPDQHGPSRLSITARETHIRLALNEKSAASFDTLHPAFASRFGGHKYRWANVLTFPSERGAGDIALVYPLNNHDRGQPRVALFDNVIISREGWVFPQEYIDLTRSIRFESGADAFANWLTSRGPTVQTTPEGRVAREVLRSLGGAWAVHLDLGS